MELLPFNLERLSSEKYFISNSAGFNAEIEKDVLDSLTDNPNNFDDSMRDELVTKLFISKEENFSTSLVALASASAKRIVSEIRFSPIFMIVPTLRCDHSCKYCQVSRAPISASGFDLDEKLIPKIIDSIKKISLPPYKIEIQGGEPLVRFDLIEAIYKEADEKIGSDKFEMVIATTLSLISNKIIKWAKGKNIQFSVSLDGEENVHNFNRILPNDNSFEKFKSGANLIFNKLSRNQLSTVTTVTSELIKNPQSIVDAHIEFGLNNLFLRPISPYGFAHKKILNSYSIEEYLSFYEDLLDIIIDKNKHGYELVEHSAAIHMKRILVPGYSGYADLKSPSGVLFNCILFNYDGKLYGSDESRMLDIANPESDFSFGSIENPNLIGSEYYKSSISDSFNLVHPGCIDCAFQPYCGADPCMNISTQGEPVGDKSLSRYCQYHKGMFKLLLRRYYSGDFSESTLVKWAHA